MTTHEQSVVRPRPTAERYDAQTLVVWSGPVGIVLVLVGWMIMADFLPPPSASLSPEETLAVWREHRQLKILGLLTAVWGGTFYVLFAGSIFSVLRRIEHGFPILSLGQVLMSAFGIAFYCWNFIWLACVGFIAAEAPASVVDPLSDIGFIITFAPVAPFCMQYLLVGLVILRDRSEQPLIPRWVGYLNLWVSILLVPAQFIPLVESGPLAWDGILSFWVAVLVFTVWFFVMFWFVRSAIRKPRRGTE